MKKTHLNIIKNGPILIDGDFTIEYNGETVELQKKYLCRCGKSNNKPYCDGTHKKINFED